MNELVIGVDGRFLQDKFDGVGRYTFGLVGALRQLDARHRVVLFHDPALPNTRFRIEALSDPGRLTVEEVHIPLYGPLEHMSWRRQARRHRLNVFHSPYFWSPLLLPCPLVTTVHDMIFDRHPEYLPGVHYRLPYLMSSRLMMRRAAALVAVSHATARDIVTFAGERVGSRLAVIPNGVDDRFRPSTDEEAKRAVRRRYGLPERFVLAMGARRPHKNIERLVTSFDRLAGGVPHSLVLAGEIDRRFGNQESPVAARLRHAGRLIEVGRVAEQDLPTLYSAADLFVQPSIIEGFGLPLLEAMACGAATACSNTGAMREVAGDAAALFDPLSVDSMTTALEKALRSAALRTRLSALGVARASRFRWESVAKSTLEVYRAAAARRPRGVPGLEVGEG